MIPVFISLVASTFLILVCSQPVDLSIHWVGLWPAKLHHCGFCQGHQWFYVAELPVLVPLGMSIQHNLCSLLLQTLPSPSFRVTWRPRFPLLPDFEFPPHTLHFSTLKTPELSPGDAQSRLSPFMPLCHGLSSYPVFHSFIKSMNTISILTGHCSSHQFIKEKKKCYHGSLCMASGLECKQGKFKILCVKE